MKENYRQTGRLIDLLDSLMQEESYFFLKYNIKSINNYKVLLHGV